MWNCTKFYKRAVCSITLVGTSVLSCTWRGLFLLQSRCCNWWLVCKPLACISWHTLCPSSQSQTETSGPRLHTPAAHRSRPVKTHQSVTDTQHEEIRLLNVALLCLQVVKKYQSFCCCRSSTCCEVAREQFLQRFAGSLRCRSRWSSRGSQHKACCRWWVFHSMMDFDTGCGRSGSPGFSSDTWSSFQLEENTHNQH